MKVVGIISSPHEEGASATLVREALTAAQEAGAEVREIFLARMSIEFCRACGACLSSGRCPIQDDFERVKSDLAEADGVILSSPTYGAAVSARVKNLFDRLGQFAFLTSFFGGKYVAAIATAGSFGNKATLEQLTSLPRGGVFQRARVSCTLAVNLHGQRVQDLPDARQKAEALGRRLAEDIRRGRRYPLQGLRNRIFNSLLMRPMLGRGIRDHRDKGLRAVYAELVRKGLLQPAT
jgi:multimeric flavodoxin WrbA